MLRVGLVGSTSTLDIIDSQIAPLLTGASLESLVRLKPDGSLEPRLAASVDEPQPDGVRLQAQEGCEVLGRSGADLRRRGLLAERLRDPASYTAAKYRSVDTIEATDKYTVTVTLKTPDSNWPTQASMFSSQIIQKKFYEAAREGLR